MGRFDRLLQWAVRADKSGRKTRARSSRDRRLVCEELELRALLSVAPHLAPLNASGAHSVAKDAAPTGLSPNQIRAAYGLGTYSGGVLSNGISFNGVSGDGRGQTIAIVDAYDYPTALADLNGFSTYYSLPKFNVSGGPAFKVLTQTGQTVSSNPASANYGATDPAGAGSNNWEGEAAMDIEWAHAMAPMANITLYEATNDNNNLANLFAAAKTAANTTGVVAVSMSWDEDDNAFTAAQIANYDATVFTTPAGHVGGSATMGGAGLAGGVTFLAAAGDNGAYDYNGDPTTIMPEYPTDSSKVLSVGGTSLVVHGSTPNYTYGSETAWGDGTSSGTDGGGGGGISLVESQPSYQASLVSSFSTTQRAFPDVSLVADPNTGVPVYDSYDNGTASPWSGYNGGTSLSTPMFAGLIAIVDEGRAIDGKGSLDGATQTLPAIYNLPTSDFHDIISGSTGPSPEFAARAGYDLTSGRGSPIGNIFIPALVGNNSSPPTVATAASATPSPVTGKTVSLSVLGADAASGEASLRYTWSATSVPSGAATPTFSVNGTNVSKNSLATFSHSGRYIFAVTIADPNGQSITSSVSVTVNQTLTSIAVSPASVVVSTSFSQQFQATAKDQFGVALGAQPAFTWTTTTGTISSGGLLTAPAVAGTVTATSGALHGTASITVAPPSGSAVLRSDPLLSGKTSLYVTGVATNDTILVNSASVAGSVTVLINGKQFGPFSPTGRIIIHGISAAGYSDYISVSSQVKLPTWIYGDNGKDVFYGGGGANILISGSGSASLHGGAGRNILIAGASGGWLYGGAGDGLLVGGTTPYSTNDKALLAIMSEWNSADSYATRVGYVTGKAGGLNGSYFLNASTVHSTAADTLLAGGANDVFFQGSLDKVLGRRVNETLVSIS